MKRAKFVVSVIALLVSVAFVARADTGPALVIKEGGRLVLDADGDVFDGEDPQVHLVRAYSRTDVWAFKCRGRLPEKAALPERGAVQWNAKNTGYFLYIWIEGLDGNDDVVETYKWHQTLTPKGKFTLTGVYSEK